MVWLQIFLFNPVRTVLKWTHQNKAIEFFTRSSPLRTTKCWVPKKKKNYTMLNPKQVPPCTQYPYSTNRKGSDMQSTTNWNKKYFNWEDQFFVPEIIFWEDQLSLGGRKRELIRSGSIILLLYANLSYW